ncbi:hypothetical protein ACFPN2_25400 [Steroidobacter flavus]|uniref:Secreted protein n=1 Tax=Steroidobacter flavus TaxID=1842136 RepID=A0ABV8T1F7_9GAMM
MNRSSLKMWSALGVFSMVGAAAPAVVAETASAPSAAGQDEFAGGSLSHALDKVFAGEGGEGGLGFTKMTRAFSVPALTTNQLRQVFTGNTLGQSGKIAAHLRPDGKVEGWHNVDTEVKFERCPKVNAEGDGLFIHDETQCMQRTFTEFKNATWSIKGDQLCLPKAAVAAGEGTACYYAALVLNSVVVFGEDGKMEGKGNSLWRGSVVPKMPAANK